MALTVATNTGALMAQAAASSVNKDMEMSMERLASGKRINGASDDAAGVAIASRLTSEIRGTNQAIRNAMDGQAMIDTAEGAHQEIEAILQRMRELAVQSANDTNSSNDRTNLQAEATALSTEIDRIAETTSWAGINLLDASGGASGSFEFQVGSRSSAQDEITVSIGSMTSSTLGVTANNTSAGGATLTEVAHNALQIGGTVKAGDIYSFTINDEAMTYTAVTADENAVAATARAAVAAKIVTAIQTADNDHAGLTVSASGDTVTVNHDVQRFTSASADTVTAGASLSGDVLKLTFSDFATTTAGTFTINGEVVEVTAGTFTTASKYGMSQLGMKQAFEDAIAAETNLKWLSIAVTTSSTDALEFTVTSRDNTATFIQSVGANPAAGSSTINLDSANNSQTAIGLIDTAIQNVNAQRANLGAVSNRLDSTVSNLTNISSNLQAGRGRIEDADFAAETTSLAKSQILQQASTAMLAQANASKQNVLSLLQG